jgi:hypothetical protein
MLNAECGMKTKHATADLPVLALFPHSALRIPHLRVVLQMDCRWIADGLQMDCRWIADGLQGV